MIFRSMARRNSREIPLRKDQCQRKHVANLAKLTNLANLTTTTKSAKFDKFSKFEKLLGNARVKSGCAPSACFARL